MTNENTVDVSDLEAAKQALLTVLARPKPSAIPQGFQRAMRQQVAELEFLILHLPFVSKRETT